VVKASQPAPIGYHLQARSELRRPRPLSRTQGSPLTRRTNLGGTATMLAPNWGEHFLFSLPISTQQA
jgi:hypothetical protein